MSFRSRLLLAFVAAAVLPLGLFALGARRESAGRLEAEFRRRVEDVSEAVRRDLRTEASSVDRRLAEVERAMAADNRLRAALRGAGGEAARRRLLDFAARRMASAGLDALQVQDDGARILSSGHYRNLYGQRAPPLARALAREREGEAAGAALATLRRPEGPMVALAAARRAEIGTRTVWLLGGVSVRDRLLPRMAPGGAASVRLEAGDGPAGAAGRRLQAGGGGDPAPGASGGGEEPVEAVVRRVALPHYAPGPDGRTVRREAAFVVSHSLAPLRDLRESTDRWLAWVAAGSAALALLLGWWTSARLSRPLEALAARARSLRLDGPDVRFDTGRPDEVGDLARALDELTRRLRASASRLRDAERRATVGEIARQVNHDIRNGLAPLRNVVRHLAEVAREAPGRLAEVFRDRESTVDAALSYLEELAGEYARISSRPELRPCDVNEAVREVASGLDAGGDRVRTELSPSAGAALADPVALRRILENLVRNGLDAVGDGADGGRVEIRTAPGPEAGEAGTGPRGRGGEEAGRVVRITVADDGPGIPEEDRERVFRDFYTTREDGVGLGLSIVRRLVADLDGGLELETRPGAGSAFTVEIPAAGGGGAVAAGAGQGRGGPDRGSGDAPAADDDEGERSR